MGRWQGWITTGYMFALQVAGWRKKRLTPANSLSSNPYMHSSSLLAFSCQSFILRPIMFASEDNIEWLASRHIGLPIWYTDIHGLLWWKLIFFLPKYFSFRRLEGPSRHNYGKKCFCKLALASAIAVRYSCLYHYAGCTVQGGISKRGAREGWTDERE